MTTLQYIKQLILPPLILDEDSINALLLYDLSKAARLAGYDKFYVSTAIHQAYDRKITYAEAYELTNSLFKISIDLPREYIVKLFSKRGKRQWKLERNIK